MRRGLLIAVAAGVALGSFSVFSDYFLSNPWAIAGNVAGTWVVVAFLVGAFAMKGAARDGALGGLVALLAADIAYYVGTSVAWDMVGLSRLLPGVITWGVVSVVAGPIAGGAGAVWRRKSFRGRSDWWLAATAIGVLAGPLVAEGLYMAWLFSGEVAAFAGFAELAIGLVLPVWLLRSTTEWRVAYPTMSVIGIVVLVATAVGLRSIQMIAGSGHF
ncbi:MAG TPA: DUF6518 family protein [Candidatus Limnocylindria bacterium]|nr:DUF6518 family protein [Candidatus Limnocylindria bacterium]